MKNRLLKIILAVISIYHIAFGLTAFVSKNLAARIARDIFHMNLVLTDQLGYIVGLLAIYAIIFGFFTALATFNPAKYSYVIYVGILLYLLRLINRLIYADVVGDAFGVSNLNLWLEIILIIFFMLALFLLRPHQQAKSK